MENTFRQAVRTCSTSKRERGALLDGRCDGHFNCLGIDAKKEIQLGQHIHFKVDCEGARGQVRRTNQC